MKSGSIIFAAIVAAGFASTIATAPALAQGSGPQIAGAHEALAPAHTAGTVTRYVVGPMGHVRGFVLNNGVVVMLHGPGDAMAQRVPAGQSVRVDAFVSTHNAMMFRRATVYDASGAIVAAPRPGPGAGHGQAGIDPQRRAQHLARIATLSPLTVAGTVETIIEGGRGNPRALLLSDRSTVNVPGPLAREIRAHGIRVGDAIRANGRGGAYPAGASIFAEQVTFADGSSVTAQLGAQPNAPPPVR